MDTLSRLLSLFSLRTSLDIRCSLAAPWVLDEPPAAPGAAPYHLIIDGAATVDVPGGGQLQLGAGDIIVFPHGGAHRLHTGAIAQASPVQDVPGTSPLRWKANAGDGALTGILCGQFLFDDNAQRSLQRALPPVMVVRTAGRADFAGLSALIMMLRSETDSAKLGSAVVTAQLSAALFALVLRAWLDDQATTPGLLALLADRRLGAALHKMLEAPGHAWLVEDLAQVCFMSRATFARVFRSVAGASPAAVLTELRMAQAAIALARDTSSIGTIAEAVGYQSEAAFHRVFKRSHGMGPGEYRRLARRPSAHADRRLN
jgi:AraC family transcriptional activator of mtrCDE